MLDSLLAKRVVLVTGKGGVGKTTAVAALARIAAGRGRRVLVTEVSSFGDEDSPLAQLFGLRRFPRHTQKLAPNIWGAILLAQVGQERFIEDKIRSRRLARAALSSNALQKLLATAPSAREMGILYHLLSEYRKTQPTGELAYDFLVVDMPATGHALGITSLPNILLELFGSGQISDTLREGQEIFCNGDVAQALVVSLPEPLAVQEALELIEGLGRDQVRVGATLVNQIMENSLSETETQRLEASVGSREILGRHTLHRSVLGRRATERLRAETTVPMLTVPHFAFEDVVSEMMGAMEAQ